MNDQNFVSPIEEFFPSSLGFEFPFVLNANPNYYDYLGEINFLSSEKLELASGGGQVIHGKATGSFNLEIMNNNSAKLSIFNLIETDPYYELREDKDPNGPKIRDLPNLAFSITRETGTFAMKQEVVWRIEDEQKWPCLLYKTRYRFDKPPLAFAFENRSKGLYFTLENKDFDESEMVFYSNHDRQEVDLQTLISKGIEVAEI
ncbi:MAG: hypothetical protein AAGD96_22065 [Chloroflexota bacterium]